MSDIVKIPLTCYGISLRPLNPKQRMAVISYFQNGGNETDACRAAGYKKPNIAANRVFNHRQVARIVEKIQRKISREGDLEVGELIEVLKKTVFRDAADFVDDEGNAITNLNELPERVREVLDSFEFDHEFDKETGQTYISKGKYKMIPLAQALDMAFRITGAYAPEKRESKVEIDWDKHLEPPKDSDRVEKEIEAQYERVDNAKD